MLYLLFITDLLNTIVYGDGDVNMEELQQYIRSYRHSWWPPRPPWITLTSVFLLLVHSAYSSINCGSGIKSVGGKEIICFFTFTKNTKSTC